MKNRTNLKIIMHINYTMKNKDFITEKLEGDLIDSSFHRTT